MVQSAARYIWLITGSKLICLEKNHTAVYPKVLLMFTRVEKGLTHGHMTIANKLEANCPCLSDKPIERRGRGPNPFCTSTSHTLQTKQPPNQWWLLVCFEVKTKGSQKSTAAWAFLGHWSGPPTAMEQALPLPCCLAALLPVKSIKSGNQNTVLVGGLKPFQKD